MNGPIAYSAKEDKVAKYFHQAMQYPYKAEFVKSIIQ